MSERQMTIVLLVVMGVIIVVGAGAVYYLRFQDLATREEELAQVSLQVDEALAKKRDIPKYVAKVKDLTEKIARIRSQIPVFDPKYENDEFANLVDNLRKKCQVDISGAKFSAPRSSGPGEDIPGTIFRARYEMKVSGGFFQLLNFLNHLETERRFLVADGIKLLAGSISESRGLAPVRELQLNLSTFLQRPSAAPPGVAARPAEKPGEAPLEEPKRLSTPIPD